MGKKEGVIVGRAMVKLAGEIVDKVVGAVMDEQKDKAIGWAISKPVGELVRKTMSGKTQASTAHNALAAPVTRKTSRVWLRRHDRRRFRLQARRFLSRWSRSYRY